MMNTIKDDRDIEITLFFCPICYNILRDITDENDICRCENCFIITNKNNTIQKSMYLNKSEFDKFNNIINNQIKKEMKDIINELKDIYDKNMNGGWKNDRQR